MNRAGWLIVDALVFALLVVGVTLGVRYYLHERYDAGYSAGHAAAIAERARADDAAVQRRQQDNTRWRPSRRPATQPSRRKSMTKFSLFASALLLSACTSAPRYVVTDLLPPPKRKASLAATAPIHPAGWVDQTLSEILSR